MIFHPSLLLSRDFFLFPFMFYSLILEWVFGCFLFSVFYYHYSNRCCIKIPPDQVCSIGCWPILLLLSCFDVAPSSKVEMYFNLTSLNLSFPSVYLCILDLFFLLHSTTADQFPRFSLVISYLYLLIHLKRTRNKYRRGKKGESRNRNNE